MELHGIAIGGHMDCMQLCLYCAFSPSISETFLGDVSQARGNINPHFSSVILPQFPGFHSSFIPLPSFLLSLSYDNASVNMC